MSVYRALTRVPLLQGPLRSSRTDRLRRAIRQSIFVHETARYVVRELRRDQSARAYRLRHSGFRVLLRHDALDSWTFEEIFRREAYAFRGLIRRSLDDLGRPIRALDLGANIGLFSLYLLSHYPASEIVAFEPDPANAVVLRECIRLNGLISRCRLVEAAASTRDARSHFLGGLSAMSRLAEPEDGCATIQVFSVDVFPYLQGRDLVKIDIEGGEWAILRDPRFGMVDASVIALEYHRHLAPDANAFRAAKRLLGQAGYTVVSRPYADEGCPDAQGLVWALRRRPLMRSVGEGPGRAE
jgi:FkbM family methyltransferase